MVLRKSNEVILGIEELSNRQLVTRGGGGGGRGRVVYKSRQPAKFAGYSAKFRRLLSLLIGC